MAIVKTRQKLCCALGAILLAMLAGCGGDSSSSTPKSNTLGGQIDLNLVNAPAGAVTGLKLYDGVETYDVTLPAQTSGSVPFTFPTALSQGTAYTVTVGNNPQGIACAPSANASGTMGSTSITNVAITCTDSVFTVSGTVQMNFANPLPSNVQLGISDGVDSISVQLPAGATTGKLSPSFIFPTALKTGAPYKVTIPSNPTDLTCTLANASGTIAAANITNVSVTCSDSAFYLSGQVTVWLQQPYPNNTATVLLSDGTDRAYPVYVSIGSGALTAGQSFMFPSLVAQGATYTVSVTTDPPGNPTGLTCTPSNNHGTVKNANITNIAVNCSDAAYPLSGSITGLQIAGGVELSDGIDPPRLFGVGSTAFSFPTDLAYNSRYAVQIQGQSLVQCTLTNATGTVQGPVANLSLQCSLPELALLAGNSPFEDNSLIGQGASFDDPTGVTVDRSGNVYVADSGNSEIRRISPAGVVTTLAGSTASGSSDGNGSAASFYNPTAVAVDAAYNVYVADSGNGEIRKITPAGDVTTFASSEALASCEYNSTVGNVAVDASGNVYASCVLGNTILKVTGTGATVVANFPVNSFMYGFAVGPSNNFYAVTLPVETSGQPASLLKVTPAGVFTTIATFTACIDNSNYYGTHVTVDASGNVYVVGLNMICKITPSGRLTAFAGSGSAGSKDGAGSAASFNFASGVAADAAGNILVADSYNNEIRKVSPAGDVTTFAGYVFAGGSSDGVGSAASFSGPSGVAFDEWGNVYVADGAGIRKISPSGVVTTLAAHDGTGKLVSFLDPFAVAVDAAGNLYVLSYNGIFKVTPTGLATVIPGSSEVPVGGVIENNDYTAGGIAVDARGNVYVSSIGAGNTGGTGSGAFNSIYKITPAGVVTTLATSDEQLGFDPLGGLAVDAWGNVYAAGFESNSISKISPSGEATILAGSGATGSTDGVGSAASFNEPSGIALDSSGNLYVADTGNCEIRKITPAGYVTTIVGNYEARNFYPGPLPGSLGPAQAVAVSPPDQFGNWNMVIATQQDVIAEIVYASAAFYQ